MRQENKLAISIIAVIIALISLTLILFLNIDKTLTGQSIKNFEYSWTKAICDDTHCQDYEIKCRGSILISQNPIKGAIIEKPENWIDSRSEEYKNKLCG